jgi:hypothetical protein
MIQLDPQSGGFLQGLASATDHVAYIQNATKNEYLVPEHLLNDGDHVCQRLRARQWPNMTDAQRGATESLERSLRSFPDDLLSSAELLNDPTWISVREAAGALLRAFGYQPRA